MRSAEFDKQQVLRKAMVAFMQKGYTKTSMTDLKKATGLHPGSIYCAFENKKGLLLAAIAQYHQDRAEQYKTYFENETCPKIGLKNYLDSIVNECISCDPSQACLLQKALNELAEQESDVQDLISAQLNSWQQALTDSILKAQQLGYVSKERTAAERGQYLVMGIYGLRTYAHTHPSADVLRQLAEQLLDDALK